jgi:hypothetical protein
MLTYTYDGKGENLEKALEVYSKGGQVLCHICTTPLLIITDKNSVAQHKLSPGIYCHKNHSHIYQKFIYQDKFDEFNRRFGGNS